MYLVNTSIYSTEVLLPILNFGIQDTDIHNVGFHIGSKPHSASGEARGYISRRSPFFGNPAVHYEVLIWVGESKYFPTWNMHTRYVWKYITGWIEQEECEEYNGANTMWEMRMHNGRQQWRARECKTVTLPYGGKKSTVVEFRNWQEGLIGIAAHELCHVEQYRDHRRNVEAECEWYAAGVLEKWRKEQDNLTHPVRIWRDNTSPLTDTSNSQAARLPETKN